MTERQESPVGQEVRKTSAAAIALAWVVVAIPALWGISQTIRTSMRLFTAPAASTVQPPAH